MSSFIERSPNNGIVSLYAEIRADCSAANTNRPSFAAVNLLEVIVAPGYTDEALEVFAAKKNLRLMTADVDADDTYECMSVAGGLLVQNRDNELFSKWDIVTKAKPTQAQIDEMAFGMTVAMFFVV